LPVKKKALNISVLFFFIFINEYYILRY